MQCIINNKSDQRSFSLFESSLQINNIIYLKNRTLPISSNFRNTLFFHRFTQSRAEVRFFFFFLKQLPIIPIWVDARWVRYRQWIQYGNVKCYAQCSCRLYLLHQMSENEQQKSWLKTVGGRSNSIVCLWSENYSARRTGYTHFCAFSDFLLEVVQIQVLLLKY